MTLLLTTIESLRSRRRKLESDLAKWRQRSDSGDLKQHHSQILRITEALTGAITDVLGETALDLAAPVPADATLESVPDLRRAVGSIHLVWEFFRGKLAQRDVDTFEDHLGAADDLAWACVLPFQQAVVAARSGGPNPLAPESLKEPPLVFYAEDRTPFAKARTKTFHPDGLDAKDTESFAEVLVRLPVPVIGIPWAIANRVPELVLVGHEAGHVIAEDFGLAPEAKELLGGLAYAGDDDGLRKGAWTSWSDEIFADVIGVLATGTAFVAALCAELAGGVEGVRRTKIDKNKPGKYPSPTLRVAICERLLERLDVAPSKVWRDVYNPIVGDSEAFTGDVQAVADALFDRPWDALGGRRLVDVLPWDKHAETAVSTIAKALLEETLAPIAFSPRVWVAAALHASQTKPDVYATKDLDTAAASQIVKRRADAVRSQESNALRLQLRPTSGLESTADRAAELRRADRALGAKLISDFLKL